MRLEISDTRPVDQGGGIARTLEFDQSPITIGSDASCMVKLPPSAAAPQQGQVVSGGNGVWLYEPRAGSGRVTINGELVSGRIPLADDDAMRVDHVTIRFHLGRSGSLLSFPEPGAAELARIRNFPLPRKSEVRQPGKQPSLPATHRTSIRRFAEAILACDTIGELMEQAVAVLLKELGATSVWMGVRPTTDEPLKMVETQRSDRKPIGEPPLLETFLYRCLIRYQFVRIPRTDEVKPVSILAIPILVGTDPLGLIYVDARIRKHILDAADLDFLIIAMDRLAPLVQGFFADEMKQKHARVKSRLMMLREVQESLVPQSVPRWPGLQLAAFACPGSGQPGDIYDVMRLPNGLPAILVGHVKAEPSRAALALMEVRTAFRVAGMHADPPRIQLKALNWLLSDHGVPCTLSAAIAIVNPKTGAAEIATAGDVRVLVTGDGGRFKRFDNPEIPPVGSTKTFEPTSVSARIRDGESLAFFTNGCTTAANRTGEPLGEDRVIEALCDGFGQSPTAVLDELLTDLAPYLKGGDVVDDITMLLVRRSEATITK